MTDTIARALAARAKGFTDKLFGGLVTSAADRTALQQALTAAGITLPDPLARKAVTGFSKLKAALDAGRSGQTLFISDSTGDNAVYTRCSALFAIDRAAEFPKQTTLRYDYDSTAQAWKAPVQVSTGTTSAVHEIWNFAVSGSRASYGFGLLFDRAMRGLAPDCVIFNHGHNHVVMTNPSTPHPIEVVRGEFLAAIEMIRSYFPTAGIVTTKQNPRQDSNVQDVGYAAWDHIAAMLSMPPIDVATPFNATGKPTSLYINDGLLTHPNDAGYVIWRKAVEDLWAASASRAEIAHPASFIAPISSRQNLLRNGGFQAFGGAVPDGWASGGSPGPAIGKDTTTVAREELGYSVKLTPSASSQCWIQQEVDAALTQRLRGKYVTPFAMQWVDAAGGVNVGRMQVSCVSAAAGGTQSRTSRADVTQASGWRPIVVSGFRVPDDGTNLRVTLFADASTSGFASNPAYFDQAVLVPGYLPRRIA